MADGPGARTHFEEDPLTLLNIANGAAVPLFDDELRKVLENIQDPNSEASPNRSITLKFTFEPSKSRNEATVTVEASSKLAPQAGAAGTVWMGVFRGKPVAAPYKPHEQQSLLDEAGKPRAVNPGTSAADAAGDGTNG